MPLKADTTLFLSIQKQVTELHQTGECHMIE